jgi:hypothetical protein
VLCVAVNAWVPQDNISQEFKKWVKSAERKFMENLT